VDNQGAERDVVLEQGQADRRLQTVPGGGDTPRLVARLYDKLARPSDPAGPDRRPGWAEAEGIVAPGDRDLVWIRCGLAAT